MIRKYIQNRNLTNAITVRTKKVRELMGWILQVLMQHAVGWFILNVSFNHMDKYMLILHYHKYPHKKIVQSQNMHTPTMNWLQFTSHEVVKRMDNPRLTSSREYVLPIWKTPVLSLLVLETKYMIRIHGVDLSWFGQWMWIAHLMLLKTQKEKLERNIFFIKIHKFWANFISEDKT